VSLPTGCLYALARATGVGVAAVLVGSALQGAITSPRRRERLCAWTLLLIPYVTPALLVGYGWSSVLLSLPRRAALNELLYGALLLMRFVPVATLTVHFAPRSLTPEATHCFRLGCRGSSLDGRGLRFWLRGPGRAAAAAFALLFLFAFGDFEMASLLGRPTWTVSLFDAQVGGTFLSQSLRLALVPLVAELVFFVLAAMIVVGHRARVERRDAPARGRARAPAWAYLVTAALVVTLVPTLVILHGTFTGGAVLVGNFVLAKEMLAGLLFAAGAAVIAYLAAEAIARRPGAGMLSVSLVCLPGLLGALLLSLLVLAVFQLPVARAAGGTPVPLLAALTLLLIPFALFLAFLFVALRPQQSLHLAGLLMGSGEKETRRRASAVRWDLATRKRFWVAFLLLWWGYFDLTAASILAPAGMTPVSVRLYNMMHYGQMPTLSAMVAVAVLVPLAALGLAAAAWRLYGRLVMARAA
jgi:ABC-type Fe3+ transport system permease subunit